MENKNLHLLFKFKNIDKDNEVLTMSEHLKIYKKFNSFIWGQFSFKQNLSGLNKTLIKKIKSQTKNNKNSFVFFYDKTNSLLYCGRYLSSWPADEFNKNHKKISLVPSYYHHHIGLPSNPNGRCFCFIEVDNIISLDFACAENILIASTQTKLIDNTNSTPVFYINLEEEFESFLNDSINNLKNDNNFKIDYSISENEVSSKDFIDLPKPISKSLSTLTKENTTRVQLVINNAFKIANYKCEVDKNHTSFISRKTNQQYLEAHHLIPLFLQDNFSWSLDVESNIVSLCPNCHKLLHLAKDDERFKIIKLLLNNRRERLKNSHLHINFEDLKKLILKHKK